MEGKNISLLVALSIACLQFASAYITAAALHPGHAVFTQLGSVRDVGLPMSSRANYDNFRKFHPRDFEVAIEAPTMNSRRITADVIIDAPIDKVWRIISDYNNLATHVPNLIQSYLVPVPGQPEKLRLFQEGAQKIIGFDFRASLLMDMTEYPAPVMVDNIVQERKLGFELVESRMFSSFDGVWAAKHVSRRQEFDQTFKKEVWRYKTRLTYSVLVKPRGPVPVIALEWRIKEDVPVNLWAVKQASERLPYTEDVGREPLLESAFGAESAAFAKRPNWYGDETLGSYITNDNPRW